MKIIKNYFSLKASKRKLIGEALIALIHAWLLVRFGTFDRYARRLGTANKGEYLEDSTTTLDVVAPVRWAIETCCKPFGDAFTCLMKAMAGKAMLNRRDIRNTIILGAKINMGKGQSEEKAMQAHAWLNVGEMVVLGGEEKDGYIPVTSYTGP